MTNKLKIFAALLILSCLLVVPGCNKDKAKAIKVAAEQFRDEATLALNMTRDLIIQSVDVLAMPESLEVERIAKDLESVETLTAEDLSFIITEQAEVEGVKKVVADEFKQIENYYQKFAAIYESFPAGSFFAQDAVKDSEKLAIKLTVQMINFADTLQRIPVQFNNRRILIIEQYNNTKEITNTKLKMQQYKIIAADIIQLRKDENKAKNAAIIQLLKAAQAGKLVAELLRNYEIQSVGDILSSINDVMEIINGLNIENENITQVLGKYNEISNSITNDPYWKELLDVKFN